MTTLKNLFNGGSSKFLVSILGAVAEVAATGHTDWKTIVAAAATAVAVYFVPNAQKGNSGS